MTDPVPAVLDGFAKEIMVHLYMPDFRSDGTCTCMRFRWDPKPQWIADVAPSTLGTARIVRVTQVVAG